MQRFANRPARRWLLSVTSLLWASVAVAEPYWPPITAADTGESYPGKWVWAELLTRDVGRAAEFYGKVFGWTFETYGPADDARTYTLVLADGEPIGGMVFANPRDRSLKRDARWIGLVSVTDVAATARAVTAHGGRVLVAPKTLGERGREALFADPEGATFGVIASATGDPDDYLAGYNEWLWNELWADDSARMADFYRQVLGYGVDDGAVPGEASGIHLVAGGRARAGILPKPAKVPSSWLPYIRVESVADTVSRARDAGGAVVMEPGPAHGTTVAILLDPTGAPFAVAEWNPPTGDTP
jgi:predicted enzyme related to lactoylglutathione lyase